jgi:hypothetical protein
MQAQIASHTYEKYMKMYNEILLDTQIKNHKLFKKLRKNYNNNEMKKLNKIYEQLYKEPLYKELYLKKYDIISFDLLEKLYQNYDTQEMNKWMQLYFFEQDSREPFKFEDEVKFKNFIYDSIWKINDNNEILFKKLKFLCRTVVYQKIKETIGSDWHNKTILEFGAGKCIHSWLLGGLFKKVVAVEIQSKEIYIGLKIHQILGERNNVDFYLGDIETCHEELIEKYKPDFLLFQMGLGFWSLNDKFRKERPNLISEEGNKIAQTIASKYNLPYWYN